LKGLVVVDGSGVLGPELDLVEMQFGRPQIALGGVDEIGMEGQVVQVPRPVGELLDTGELAAAVVGVARRVGEVVLRSREVQPQGFLGRLQLVGSEESLDQGEPLFTHLVQSRIRQPHRLALYASGKTTAPWSPQTGG
jgi:hypothetical protein